MTTIDLEITALAAGGDGVARDANGRVTFVPRTAPGDRVRARIVQAKRSFAHAELVEVVAAGAARVEPVCPHVARGCGGCQWQQVERGAQLAAKHAIVTAALRRIEALTVHPIASPAPPLGWRRRARFHVVRGRIGLYRLGSHEVLAIPSCPQLEPALDAALAVVITARPPDGELALLVSHEGRVVVGTERRWRDAATVIGEAGIVGVVAARELVGEGLVEVEPGMWSDPWDFAQASAAGNAAMIAQVSEIVGTPTGDRDRLVELYAGAGNFTRALLAAGWDVVATDVVEPARPLGRFALGAADEVLAALAPPVDVVVLDPPRAGAAEALAGILRLAPATIAYVSCDPATLARDLEHLIAAGYRATDAWPFDVMPQTSHVEVVAKLVRGAHVPR